MSADCPFADFAELVWRRLDAGETQQSVADSIGWSRGQVSNYAALSGINSEAWTVIATTIRRDTPPPQNDAVADIATTVAFTERLLRELLPLTADQQVELVRRLALVFLVMPISARVGVSSFTGTLPAPVTMLPFAP